ncbi:O-antigen ligase family protein [Gordonia amicalis]|uniref:O-antigen ligase family protein n=1 Tax=Gordonia amicalis TaxID=89053 RepID=UPI0024BA3F52|nr:O-antigen ligase family protein [Gordonia amicalis]MDJ0455415.1 O-antigen ligase family protein [Gordonia amicalis]MDV7078741.1 O-antigen ligase family protein [Gordonia amicalis]
MTRTARISLASLTLWLFAGTLIGLFLAYPTSKIIGDIRYPLELTVAVVVAAAVVQDSRCLRATAVTLRLSLWVSALLTLSASAGLLVLSGRSEAASLISDGGGAAQRFLTSATFFALATVCFCLARALVLKRGLDSWSWWLPGILIVLLAFSRNHVLAVGVALTLAICVASWATLPRILIAALASVSLYWVMFIVLPPTIDDLPIGNWYAAQIGGYADRVIEGLNPSVRSADPSARYRTSEIVYLGRAFSDSIFVGHGFGFPYQPPVLSKSGDFWLDRARYYSHNFYWWTAAKTGLLGLTTIAVAFGWPMVRGLRSTSSTVRCGAVALGAALAVSYLAPLPLDTPGTLVVGGLLGLVLGWIPAKTQPITIGLERLPHPTSPSTESVDVDKL